MKYIFFMRKKKIQNHILEVYGLSVIFYVYWMHAS